MLGQQPVLGLDHVGVVVGRELHAEAVGGLGRLPVADGVGQDDEPAPRVERSARSEQHPAEGRAQEARRIAAGAVQHQHRRVLGIAEGQVVDLHLGQDGAVVEAEVLDRPGLGFRLGGLGARGACQQHHPQQRQSQGLKPLHRTPPSPAGLLAATA